MTVLLLTSPLKQEKTHLRATKKNGLDIPLNPGCLIGNFEKIIK